MPSIERIASINPVNSPDWRGREAVVVVRCECRCLPDAPWLGLAERVLRSWQMTIRLALLVMLLAGMAVLTVALGIVR